MKEIPFEAAKKFCEDYEKDQCIILCFDKQSGLQWVTTYGTSDEDSAQAAHGGKLIKDLLKMKREKDEIPSRFIKWEVERVESYWHLHSRNGQKYVEITFWIEPHTLERKETKREAYCYTGGESGLPDWAKVIKERKRSLEDDRIY